MKILLCLATLMISITPSFAEEQKASATWITDGAINKERNTIQTIVQMDIDDTWHTYWVNPGESGLAPSLEAKLPDGWKIGELRFPVPKSFSTGGLLGFGYEGKVNMPIDLIPPTDFQGDLPPIHGTLSWLTCNDDSCVPGKEELTLSKGSHAEIIKTSYDSLPKPLKNAKLSVAQIDDNILITLELPDKPEINPSEFEILPATPDIIAPSAKPVFAKDPNKQNTWSATAPKNEYLSEPPTELSILLKNGSKPSFTASTAPGK